MYDKQIWNNLISTDKRAEKINFFLYNFFINILYIGVSNLFIIILHIGVSSLFIIILYICVSNLFIIVLCCLYWC